MTNFQVFNNSAILLKALGGGGGGGGGWRAGENPCPLDTNI